MIVNKQILLNAVKKVLPGVDSGKTILEGADSIIFSASGIHSYNARISVTVPLVFDETMQCAVNGKDLYNLLKTKTNDTECKIIGKQDSLKISGENWNGILKHVEIDWIKEKIELLNSTDPDLELPDDFVEGLSVCFIPGNKKAFNGVYIKGAHMYATNKQIMNIRSIGAEVQELWLGQESVKEFNKLKSIFCKYKLSSSTMGDWVHFKDTEGVIYSVALKDTSIYQPALNFMESNRNTLVKGATDLGGTVPEGFSEAVSACASMASQTEDTKQKHLQVVFCTGYMMIKGVKSAGKLQYMLDWSDDMQNIPTGKMLYNFIAADLNNACKKVTKFFVKPITGTEETLLVFYNDNFRTVLINTKSGTV